ncbi:hypothetical protein [Rhodococcus sp. BS-15]|uniref:hypothetical protein n=1 Tax=Rhodococcus sp. BS-15 TaxID=1304954 RepID=UPI000A7C651A|nr:hypothetical protein [Rhodococcus sp. BS-15]
MSNISVERPAATDDADVVTLTITHPDRSESQVSVGVRADGTLDVSIDPAADYTTLVDVEGDTVYEGPV